MEFILTAEANINIINRIARHAGISIYLSTFNKPKTFIMKLRLQIFPLLGIYFLLISATCIERTDTSIVNKQNITIANQKNSRLLKVHKLNFFQRLIVKFFIKKDRLADGSKADNQASTSLWLGIGACAFILLGLFVPYVILASLPTGIAAMITGGSALRNKTSLVGKARTGKALGLGALITFGVLLILAAIVVSSWY